MQHFYEFFREHAVAIALALLLAIPANGATHTVVNEVNYHTFSKDHPVLLRIRPGDTVITKTVDSAGFDAEGVRHTKTHGNPLTGAFLCGRRETWRRRRSATQEAAAESRNRLQRLPRQLTE